MSLRVVNDAAGIAWYVWHVLPDVLDVRSPLAVAPQYADGWLAFEPVEPPPGVPAEKRRLAPVPPGWATGPDDAVLGLLAAATPVRRRPRV